MVWEKEETEDDESLEEEQVQLPIRQNKDSATIPRGKEIQGTSEGKILSWQRKREKWVTGA